MIVRAIIIGEVVVSIGGVPPELAIVVNLAALLAISTTAGVVEEAGFRGFMLSPIQRRHGFECGDSHHGIDVLSRSSSFPRLRDSCLFAFFPRDQCGGIDCWFDLLVLSVRRCCCTGSPISFLCL